MDKAVNCGIARPVCATWSIGAACAWLTLTLLLALPARAQPADCTGAATQCLASCAGKVLFSRQSPAQCKAQCDAERDACLRRVAATPAPSAPGAAATASLPISGHRIGKRVLGVAPLLEAEGLRPFIVPTLDGIALIDLTGGEQSASTVAGLPAFMQAYRANRYDWATAASFHHQPKQGGNGSSLIARFLSASSLVLSERNLAADLGQGEQGQLGPVLEPAVVQDYLPCAGPPRQGSDCRPQDRSYRTLQWRGANEFERARTRSAFVESFAGRMRAAFAPRQIDFVALEQLALAPYDFQREAFPFSAMRAPAFAPRKPESTLVGLNGLTGLRADRGAPIEVKVAPAQAERWTGLMQPATGNGPRTVFLLSKLQCQTGQAPQPAVAECRMLAMELYANPELSVKLTDL